MITQSQIKKLFNYKNNELYWVVRPSNVVDMSKPAGYLRPDGYRVIKINMKNNLAHRLIFMLHNNYLPEMLDHINNNPSDNRIENLRPATYVQNGSNHKLSKANSSGVKGVYFCKRIKRWCGQFRHGSKKYSTATFLSLDDAAAAIKELRRKVHGEYANNG